MAIAYISRTERFSAAHRLHANQLSDEDNKLIFGKCNGVNSHGHNYKIEVTVKGEVKP
jgi:6-pyruvoyltetrahydropterin/6-carboxytetrahydropterin synthase